MNQKRVIAVGDVAADILIRLPPKSGRAALKGILPPLYPGGTVGNTAVALARFGLPVSLITAVGADGYGRSVQEGFEVCGVDTAHVAALPGRFTLVITAVVDRDGERYLANYPHQGAASAYYPPERLDPGWIRQAGWVHASGSSFLEGTTREATLAAMQIAREAGVPVSFDLNLRPFSDELPAGLAERLWKAVGLADFVLGSGREEFTALTGMDDPADAARALARPGGLVIARMGPEGCLVFAPQRAPVRVPAFQTTVVDTLGAGDVFDAGFIAAMARGRDVVEAARWGNAAAALSLAGEGAALHLRREALEGLLAG